MKTDLLFAMSIPIKAVPQSRPRATLGTSKRKIVMHDDRRSVSYKNVVRMRALEACHSLGLDLPVAVGAGQSLAVDIDVFFKPPSSCTARKRQEYIDGMHMPLGRPDVDNLAKAILDAMNGAVYEDDACITDLSVIKRYGKEDKVIVCVYRLEVEGKEEDGQ